MRAAEDNSGAGGASSPGSPSTPPAGNGNGKKKRAVRVTQRIVLKLMVKDPKTGLRTWQETEVPVKGKVRQVITALTERKIGGDYIVARYESKPINIKIEQKEVVTVT